MKTNALFLAGPIVSSNERKNIAYNLKQGNMFNTESSLIK